MNKRRNEKYNTEKYQPLLKEYFAAKTGRPCINNFVKWMIDTYKVTSPPSVAWFQSKFKEDVKREQTIRAEKHLDILKENPAYKDFKEYLKEFLSKQTLAEITDDPATMKLIRDRYNTEIYPLSDEYVSEVYDDIAKYILSIEPQGNTAEFRDELWFSRKEKAKNNPAFKRKMKAIEKHEKLVKHLYTAPDVPFESPLPLDVNWGNGPSVYILYNDKKEPLYVGKTINLASRLNSHLTTKAFAPDVKWIGIKQYPTKADMDLAEIATIQEKHPLHNTDCLRADQPKLLHVIGDVEELKLPIEGNPFSSFRKRFEPFYVIAQNCDDESEKFREWAWSKATTCYYERQMIAIKEDEQQNLHIWSKGQNHAKLGDISEQDTARLREMQHKGLFYAFSSLQVSLVDARCIGSPNLILMIK